MYRLAILKYQTPVQLVNKTGLTQSFYTDFEDLCCAGLTETEVRKTWTVLIRTSPP